MQLSYFYKYAEIGNYITIKSSDTTSNIATTWYEFITTDPIGIEIVNKYHSEDEAENNNHVNNGRQIYGANSII